MFNYQGGINIMKKNSVFKEIVIGTMLIFSLPFLGCESTPAPETKKIATEVSETEKIEKKEIAVEETADVVFVKQLQKELSKGNIDGALKLFDSIPEELAGDKDMNILHSSLYISAGDLENANVIAKKLFNAHPKDMDVLELNSVIAKAQGNKAEYKTFSEMILNQDPYNAEINIQTAQEYAMNKKYKQAKQAYQKALVSEPKNVDALFGYGQMTYFIGDIDEAADTFKNVLELDPKNASSYSYLGKISAEKDNYLSAIKYVQEAIKIDNENYNFHMDLGKYYQQVTKPKDAIKEWETARDLDPTYFLAYAYLAGINDEMGNFAVALENYRKVIETNPNYYYAYESAGIVEWHEGNWAEARKDFLKAWEVSGKKDWAYALMIAATYMKEKNNFKAKEWLQPILKTMDRESLEYQMVKFYYDNYSKNAAVALTQKINKEDNSTKRGKLWFYMGLYNEIYAGPSAAEEMYSKVTAMQAPMFFEFRMAEWGLGL